jgi:hypothetical protein
MVDKKTFSPLRDQKGQAIFELIIFIPFLVFLYTIYSTTGNAINASINQQKSVRGYFYSLIRGNSYINSLPDLEEFSGFGVKTVGFASLGWREKSDKSGKTAYAPCFKFISLLKGSSSSEDCDSANRDTDSRGNGVSHYVRVFTFYGVCGPVYTETADQVNGLAFYEIKSTAQSDPMRCSLSDAAL